MKRIPLERSALIVIDMQRYFLDPKARAFLDTPASLIPNACALIEAFRRANLPVLFTRHAHRRDRPTGQMGRWWGDDLPFEDDPFSQLYPAIKPEAGEVVLIKTHYSAFEETELDHHLRTQGIDTLVLCGVMTNVCVETTARHAFMKELQPVIVADACATKSDDYQNASLTNLAYAFGPTPNTKSILAMLPR